MMTFQELGLAEPLLRAVAAQGYTTPTPIQLQAIPHVLAGRDLLGCAQTGTGKTAAFALPILQRMARPDGPQNRRSPIRVLVLGPTRELVAQIADSFQTYGRNSGLRQTVVFGGVSQHPQTRALQKGVDILIATPGRLLDLMNQGFVDLRAVEVFVLDEADRMLDMGFLPDLRRVIAKLPAKRQTLFFSATMPPDITKLADTILCAPIKVRIPAVKANTPLIEQSVFFVSRQQKSRLLASVLTSSLVTRALVFTRTKHGADGVVRRLGQSGIRAAAIHGNKSQQARQRTLAAFKDDDAAVLVATDIASRGIDVEGISHVVNYDLPREPETYVHRIGRTGRAGAAGTAISFCDDEERQHLVAIERLIGRSLAVAGKIPAGPATPRPATSAAPSGGRSKKRSFPHARRRCL